MPKKFKGENSKATEARARKAAVANEEAERRKKEAEDALWVDDDKHLAKKSQRKDDKEKKRLEQLERKKELARLHDEEMESTKGNSKAKTSSSTKVTRHELDRRREMDQAAAAAERNLDRSITVVDSEPLEENLNRLTVEGEARTVDDAITLLSQSSKDGAVDRHPEKRVKAAYQEFEDARLPELKKENPNLRLSQLKQMLKKEWQKSPANPLNARLMK